MLRLIAALALVLNFGTVVAAEPVADLEALVEKASSEMPATRVYFAPGPKKWAKIYLDVADVRFDVKKTDSLGTPLIGVVNFITRSRMSPRFHAEHEAGATNSIDEAVPTRVMAVTLYYAWRADRWQFANGERLAWFEKPGMPRDHMEVSAEALAKDPALRAWSHK